MGKRRGAARSRPDEYIHYGKPEMVTVTVREPVYENGNIRWVSHTDTVPGTSTDSRTARDTGPLPRTERTQGFHHDKCEGQRGIKWLYRRDGRDWCRPCYEFRFGISPYLDEKCES